MNNSNEIVGRMENEVQGSSIRAFLRRRDQTIDLGTFGGSGPTEALSINDMSVVVGYSSAPGGHRAFRWEDGALADLMLPLGPHNWAYDINDVGQICGWMGSFSSARAYRWDTSVVTQLHFGPLSSVAYSINNGGECVGFIHEQTPEGPFNKAVMWKADGTVVYLGGIPGYAHCRALHVNDDGVIAGYCYNSNPPPQTPLQTAFVWRQGVITDLATRTLPTFAKYPAGLNNKGQIASWGNINGPVGALLTPVLGAPGDYNCDKVVNITDLLAVIAHWGPDGGGGPADFNNDGSVNIADLLIVIANWG